MADDSEHITNPMDFHCTDTPRGMLYYHLDDLTSTQQSKLNDLKIQTVREDEKYLASHPEIRACVALITRHVMRKCPKNNVYDEIAKFFNRSKIDIQEEINEYLTQREDPKYQGDSSVGLFVKSESSESLTFAQSEEMTSVTPVYEEHTDLNSTVLFEEFDELGQPYLVFPEDVPSISNFPGGLYHYDELEKIKKDVRHKMVADIIVDDALRKIHCSDDYLINKDLIGWVQSQERDYDQGEEAVIGEIDEFIHGQGNVEEVKLGVGSEAEGISEYEGENDLFNTEDHNAVSRKTVDYEANE